MRIPLWLIALAVAGTLFGVAGVVFYLASAGPATPVAATPAQTTSNSPTLDKIAAEVLTPGGVYTQADIEANGNISPFEKYARTMMDPQFAHAKPEVGDYLCPITGSKGQIQWIIGGKSYQFCCVPCIIEYVKKAKEHPEELRDPEEFAVTAENIEGLPEPTM